MLCFFFFKQKTAYEMLRSLVGSEMCIRDRAGGAVPQDDAAVPRYLAIKLLRMKNGGDGRRGEEQEGGDNTPIIVTTSSCLLYTSEAADEEDSGKIRGVQGTKKTEEKERNERHSE
eukprot:TRINITY_DN31693_c0_g1_i1.p1 TRINITY_DN31693_c0_g1~~TRINITY_DN31693_c0_g1_i1.p1  ORF type:complete len:116 (-),score=33.09 TRINITY_DN31693_c0_g1_i1:3-350(-)